MFTINVEVDLRTGVTLSVDMFSILVLWIELLPNEHNKLLKERSPEIVRLVPPKVEREHAVLRTKVLLLGNVNDGRLARTPCAFQANCSACSLASTGPFRDLTDAVS
ncbi:hypothetical protein AGR9A_Lc10002 [Agrobacterium salinitolerans str. Hayward 0363]|nr:hypothetical protein AGR9A_Lc10002 [Agrobacterium salinitolerans str. Hayward 0363]